MSEYRSQQPLSSRASGGVVFAIAVGAVSTVFLIPYPFWSILEIALACWVIWAITRPGLFDN